MNFRTLKHTALSLTIATLAWSPLLGAMTGTLASAQTAQNTTVDFTYYGLGQLKTRSSVLNQTTTFDYDALWRLSMKTEPSPAPGYGKPYTAYTYDGLNQLTLVNYYSTQATSYAVDGLGNQLKLTSPDTGVANKTYDIAGNLATQTDARGKLTTYAYDALNRVTSITYQSGIASTFEYDGGIAGLPADIGQLTKMTDESGETTFVFDVKGRPLSKTQIVKGTNGAVATLKTRYSYGTDGSATGKLASATYPSGNRINYMYDNAGRLSEMTLNRADGYGGTSEATATVLLSDIAYTPTGAVESWKWGQGGQYQRTFDLDGRMVSYPIGDPAAGGMMRTLKYDSSSRITAITHAGGTSAAAFDQAYGYDNANRLINYTGNGTSRKYWYDYASNRYALTVGSTNYAYTYKSSTNRLLSAADPTGTVNNTFDAAGNITQSNATAYTYSDRGRMSSSTGPAGRTDYLYNGAGQRVSKTGASIPTGVNFYAYDDEGKLLGEYKGDALPVQETVYMGDQPVAVLADDVYYVYADHINTPRLLTKSSDGATVWRWDNADPFGFGAPLASAGAAGGVALAYNPRFPGQLFDKETGKHYNYFRDYDPQTGRYTQSDPIGLDGGVNTYGYVGGNPLSNTDSTGLLLDPATAASLAALDAGAGGAAAGMSAGAFVGLAAGAGVGVGLGFNYLVESTTDGSVGTHIYDFLNPEMSERSKERARKKTLE